MQRNAHHREKKKTRVDVGKTMCAGPLGNDGTQRTVTKQALLATPPPRRSPPPCPYPSAVVCGASWLPRAGAHTEFFIQLKRHEELLLCVWTLTAFELKIIFIPGSLGGSVIKCLFLFGSWSPSSWVRALHGALC